MAPGKLDPGTEISLVLHLSPTSLWTLVSFSLTTDHFLSHSWKYGQNSSLVVLFIGSISIFELGSISIFKLGFIPIFEVGSTESKRQSYSLCFQVQKF